MNAPVTLLLIVCLVIPGVGCATARGPRQLSAAPGDARARARDWSRVQRLPPGAPIRVVTRGAGPRPVFFVLADEAALIVLNVDEAVLPASTARTLRRLAARNPARFAHLRRSGAVAEGNVRVGADGVFVAGRKAADLDQVVETLARSDVMEIYGPVVARGSVAGAILGGFLGFSVGVVPGLGGAEPGVTWLALAGAIMTGGWIGHRSSSHQADGLVYAAGDANPGATR